ncbi:hypothetical protein [Thermomonas aquatica]|jgi:hypothetical protein|uniref:Lipoprotein n=1 Tax=Thermomonas aquatica TaxID=2202149 RepID=A0A5B7ZTW9_9GAMM|nr:hypothetical protein [Thermomonas aquatica]QDA57242.1 hypothetical protein FHQ07_07915 [Thermomonas aquatica]
MRIASPLACLLVLALAGCSPPKPPEEERRPDPQAKPAIVAQADAYKDAARAAVANSEQAAAKEKAALDAAAR